MPEGFSAELSAALETLATSRTRSETAIRAEAQLLAAQSGPPPIPPCSPMRTRSSGCPRIGRVAEGARDLPGVQREADGFTADLAALAIRLGLPDADAVLARQPSDADRAGLEALLDEAAKRDAKLAAADSKLPRNASISRASSASAKAAAPCAIPPVARAVGSARRRAEADRGGG